MTKHARDLSESGNLCNPFLINVWDHDFECLNDDFMGFCVVSMIDLIKANLTEKIKLKTIADRSGMSASSMYRLFKNELGISPVEFILMEKIKIAKQYLSDKHVYIKNVSYEAGFEDSNYFIRVFKQYEGITPKQYQQLLHKKGN